MASVRPRKFAFLNAQVPPNYFFPLYVDTSTVSPTPIIAPEDLDERKGHIVISNTIKSLNLLKDVTKHFKNNNLPLSELYCFIEESLTALNNGSLDFKSFLSRRKQKNSINDYIDRLFHQFWIERHYLSFCEGKENLDTNEILKIFLTEFQNNLKSTLEKKTSVSHFFLPPPSPAASENKENKENKPFEEFTQGRETILTYFQTLRLLQQTAYDTAPELPEVDNETIEERIRSQKPLTSRDLEIFAHNDAADEGFEVISLLSEKLDELTKQYPNQNLEFFNVAIKALKDSSGINIKKIEEVLSLQFDLVLALNDLQGQWIQFRKGKGF